MIARRIPERAPTGGAIFETDDMTLLQKGYLDRKDAKSAKILEQERENLYPYAPFCTKYSTIP